MLSPIHGDLGVAAAENGHMTGHEEMGVSVNGNGNGFLAGNSILEALPVSDRDRLNSKLAPTFLRVKTVLFEPGQPVDAVYFPLDGVVSLVTPLEDGAIVEVATVGNEGIVGVPLIPGGASPCAPSPRWPAAV